jgi:predicted peptidase
VGAENFRKNLGLQGVLFLVLLLHQEKMISKAFLFMLLLVALPAYGAGPEELFAAFTMRESITVPATANRAYRLLVPADAGNARSKLPVVIYLHGSGAKGTDNMKQTEEPLPRLLASPELRKRFPCFILAPQCREGDDSQDRPNNWVKWENQKVSKPAGWLRSESKPSDQLQGAMAALQDVLARPSADSSRVYLTGVSMGGSASWWWAAHEPEKFAAVVTACGLSETGKAARYAKLPLWAFHGSDDDVAPVQRSRDMIAAIQAAGGTPKFTEFTGAGHGIATRVFTENGHEVLKWLFEQRRGL